MFKRSRLGAGPLSPKPPPDRFQCGRAQLGMSVKISEDRILIGAPYAGSGGKDRGRRTYSAKSLATETAILTASNPVDDDSFGWSGGCRRTRSSSARWCRQIPGDGLRLRRPWHLRGTWELGFWKCAQRQGVLTHAGHRDEHRPAPLVVSEIGLSGANPRQFSIASQTCTGTSDRRGQHLHRGRALLPTRFG